MTGDRGALSVEAEAGAALSLGGHAVVGDNGLGGGIGGHLPSFAPLRPLWQQAKRPFGLLTLPRQT